MHDAVVVIANTLGVDLRFVFLAEVGLKSTYNVVIKNINIVISVRPALFMPESNRMANLMYYCTESKAAYTDRNALLTIPKSTHV